MQRGCWSHPQPRPKHCDFLVARVVLDSLLSETGVEARGLSVEPIQAVKQLLHRNFSVVSQGETDLGRTHLTMHEIDTGEIKLPPRRVPFHLQQLVI